MHGSPGNKKFLVNFVGSAGGGKSTMIPLVIGWLDKQSRQKGLCRPAEPSSWKVVAAAVLRPSLFSRAWTITKNMKRKKRGWAGYKRWVKWIGLHWWHKNGLLFSSKTGIWLFDEGLVHYLRKSVRPLPVELLDRCPLPDMVVNIRTDDIQAAWRRVLRTKHIPAYKILDKSRCRLMAGKHYLNFIQRRDIDEVRDYLRKWSARFCREPLSEMEISEIIKENSPAVDERKTKPKNDWLRPALESLGVVWIDIDTSDGNPPEETAPTVAEQIWKQYRLKMESGCRA